METDRASTLSEDSPIERRALELFVSEQSIHFARTDKLFAVLMLVQWMACVGVAIWISPLTWIGQFSQVHLHVLAAIFLGGLLASGPVYLAVSCPGMAITRHTIAISQMLFSALLVHLTGGRIETHFHVFGSLAFLSFYRDWRVLVTASIVVAADHYLRGLFWPQSVFGVGAVNQWRWLEHAGWVVFEDVFLIRSCLQNVQEMKRMARRHAELEATQSGVEQLVELRTKELSTSQRRNATQYAVTKVLAECSNLNDAVIGIVRTVCETEGWDVGGMWHLDAQGEMLQLLDYWRSPGVDVSKFMALTSAIRFRSGCGLPGRVFAERKSLWLDDLQNDPNFPLAKVAQLDGIRTAFAFPIVIAGEVIGVMEFFSRDLKRKEDKVLDLFQSIGEQIGVFMERKKAEFSSAQLARIVESSNDAILGCNLYGVITSWNSGAERLYGYSAVEAKGRSYSILLPEDRPDEMPSAVPLEQQSMYVENLETVRLRKDGSIVEVSISQSPLLSVNGAVIGMSCIARDISQRKKAERRVNEFYSTVSHELRTPLTSIRGALGLIEGGVLNPDEVADLVQVARFSADRLIRLINDILDLRKLEAGKLPLSTVSIDPRRFVEQTLESLIVVAEEAQVSLSAEICVNDPFIADCDRATQVLTNLVFNAIKFSPAGTEVKVVVEAGSRDNFLRFSVVDHGPGIRPDQMPELFCKFQQLDSSDSRQKGGTGLGLAICKAIVEEHGGGIGVESQPGCGSTFWFEFARKAREHCSCLGEASSVDSVVFCPSDGAREQVSSGQNESLKGHCQPMQSTRLRKVSSEDSFVRRKSESNVSGS